MKKNPFVNVITDEQINVINTFLIHALSKGPVYLVPKSIFWKHSFSRSSVQNYTRKSAKY